MSLVQNSKFSICLFLDVLGLKIMSDDHLVKKHALLDDKKKSILNSRHIEISWKGLTHDFSQKMETLSLFVSGQNMPWNIVWWSMTYKTSPLRL